MASVTYRKVGTRWHIRLQKKGHKEITKSLPGTVHEKTVAQKAAWYKEQIALERIDPWQQDAQNIMSVDEALDEYLYENLASKNWAEHTTHKTNKNVLKRMLHPIRDKVLEVQTTPQVFQDLFESLPGNAYTKKGDRGRINGYLKWCHQKGYLKEHIRITLPMEYKLQMRNTSSVKYITLQQLDDVCAALEHWFRQTPSSHGRPAEFYSDLYYFMFYSLLRKEEVPKLTAGDLQGNRLWVQGKGRRTDVITLPPPALEIARKYAAGKTKDEPLFTMSMNRAKVHLCRAIELALGKDFGKGFHQLRHGGVSYYISEGIPIPFISKLARHKSIDITLRIYADVLPDKMDEAFSQISDERFTPPVKNTPKNALILMKSRKYKESENG